MIKSLYTIILFVFLAFGVCSQGTAATVAEASIGNEKVTFENYDLSGMTSEEQEWFITFLKGNFFADGWEQISSEILMNTTTEKRDQLQIRLDELGYKIGSEWCKENDDRKIDTSMLKKWGRELKITAEEDPHLLTEVLHRIHTEVDELLD